MTSPLTAANNAVNNAVKILRDTTDLFEVDSIEDEIAPSPKQQHKKTNSHIPSFITPHSLPAHTWNRYSSGLGKLLRSSYYNILFTVSVKCEHSSKSALRMDRIKWRWHNVGNLEYYAEKLYLCSILKAMECSSKRVKWRSSLVLKVG